jgi:DNA-binding GntR family transcriptional regulator
MPVVAFENIQPLALETAPERIADQVRASVLDGSLAPGTQLTEVQLAERLGVSRGPVREAMQRLIQEGLLRAERHRGVFVMELGLDDVHDVYLARKAIEHEAARRVLDRDRSELVATLEGIVKDMRAAEKAKKRSAMVEADLRFHEALVEAAKSKRLSRMFRTLIAETRLSMAMGFEYPEWSHPAAEHQAIVDSLKRGKKAEMLKRLDEHLVHTKSGQR